jgi:hypothetical protein
MRSAADRSASARYRGLRALLQGPFQHPEVSMTTRFVTLATAAAISLCATFAMAQTPAPKPAPAPAPAAAPKAAPAPAAAPAATPAPAAKPARTAASLECSKEADTKGVHGKMRKKFMSECKKKAK